MRTNTLLPAIFLILCVNCGKKENKNTAASTMANEGSHKHLACTITPSKTSVQDDEKVDLYIQIVGGEAPYNVPAAKVTNSPKTEILISTAFENHTSSNQVVTKKVQVSDSDGEVASCSFSVTVRP